MSDAAPIFDRYARQMRYAPLGEAGQRRLAASQVLVVGCGALGSTSANLLARAGVGRLRIVDRDFVELNNLQRQVLFDEADVAAATPKAIAAAEKLRRINSQITVEPVVADVTPENLVELCRDVDCIVDGTDNFETRFLLNDVAVKLGIPWVFGGCLGAEGQTLTIVPGTTPCLRCVTPEPPPPGLTPTCDTAGITGPIIGVIASIQAMEAIKILAGRADAVRRTMLVVDLWDDCVRQVRLSALGKGDDCPTCRRREFPWLDGRRGRHGVVLCGRNAVQIGGRREAVSFDTLAERLAAVGSVTRTPFLLRAVVDRYVLTIFPDGRAIIGGTDDLAAARTVYAKYVGD